MIVGFGERAEASAGLAEEREARGKREGDERKGTACMYIHTMERFIFTRRKNNRVSKSASRYIRIGRPRRGAVKNFDRKNMTARRAGHARHVSL